MGCKNCIKSEQKVVEDLLFLTRTEQLVAASKVPDEELKSDDQVEDKGQHLCVEGPGLVLAPECFEETVDEGCLEDGLILGVLEDLDKVEEVLAVADHPLQVHDRNVDSRN